MATFGIVTRGRRNDGFYPVYIRVTHGAGSVSYIKTSFVVSDKGLKKTYTKSGKEKLVVSDTKVLKECMNEITGYVRKLNDVDSEKMTIQEVVRFLSYGDEHLSFSKYASEFITSMMNSNRANSADNYTMAVKRLHEFSGKNDILFDDLTYNLLSSWIESMMDSARKRNLYPTCIKTIYNSAMLKYNDEERDIIKIKRNPFTRIKIPSNKTSAKRSASIEDLKRFFTAKVREKYKGTKTKEKISQDVCKLIFCLAGLNTADLYDLPIGSIQDGILRYNRKKTRDKSLNGSYSEIKIPNNIKHLIEEYKGNRKLFIFSERYSSADIFSDIVSRGCKKICEQLGLKGITPYSFRHSWATIAINECAASMDDVALALNHSDGHKVTNIYVRPDYSRIDRLNKNVINIVFKRISKVSSLRNVYFRRKKK